ncbi:MAG: ABC transporter substrate-binding protein [Clostridiales bacterium]|nr:ABC transporter substrate-binding protein [Clostridiales bacterium]
MRLKKVVALMLAASMVLSATACGGSSGSSSGSGSADSGSSNTEAAAAEGGSSSASGDAEVIKIGFLAPLTGTSAENGQQVTWACQMIADLVNEANPDVEMMLAADEGLPNLGGAKIELVIADTKGDTTVATSEAKRLISEEGCVAITGQLTSGMSKAISVITEQYEIPLVTAGSAVTLTDGSEDYEWLFRYNLTDNTYIDDSYKLMDEAKASGVDISTVAFLSEDSEFGANIVVVEEAKAAEYGYEIVENMTYASNSTSLSSEVLKLKEANPDVLMVAGYATDVILLYKTMKDQDWFPKMLIGQRGGFATDDFFSALGDSTEYSYCTGGWAPDLDIACIASLQEIYPTYSNGIAFNEGMSKDCADVLMIAIALNQAGSTDAEALKEALQNPEVDFSKIFMPWESITMDEHNQNVDAAGVVMQVQNGEYVTVYPSTRASADAIYEAPGWSER